MPKATLRRKQLTPEEREKYHKILRDAAAPPGMLPADTLRAKQLPDGTWELKPLHELGRVSISVDPVKRTCSGYDTLFCKTKKQEKLTAEAYPKWFLPNVASHNRVLKALNGHGGKGIKAFATFSLPPRLMDPFVKREAIKLLPPLVWRVHARLNHGLTDASLQFVWQRLEDFAEIDAKAPALLALALSTQLQGLDDDGDEQSVSIERIHTEFVKHGGSRAAWRYLLRSKIHVAKYVVKEAFDFVRIVRIFNFLALVGEPVRPGYVAQLVRSLNENAHTRPRPLRMTDWDYDPVAIPFVRAFVRVTKRKIKESRRELSNVFDYFGEQKAAISRMDHNQLSVPWKTWKARSAAWHAAIAARPYRDEEAEDVRTWTSPLPAFETPTYSAVALLTAKELAEEGTAMHHCVRSYAARCVRGDCQIYSIKKSGKRVATLELRIATREEAADPYGPLGAEVAQLSGPCNEDVDRHVKNFAAKLATAYAGTFKSIPTEKISNLSDV